MKYMIIISSNIQKKWGLWETWDWPRIFYYSHGIVIYFT